VPRRAVQGALEAAGAAMSEKDDDNAGGGSIADAAASGDKLRLLITLRDRIAVQLEDCPIRDLSPLTIRLRDIVDEIEEIKQRAEQEGGTPGERRGTTDDGESDTPWTPDDNV
jgi:hypothetical protein